MKLGKSFASFIAGMIVMALIFTVCVPALASGNLTDLKNVLVGGIRIVIDGQELHPTDVNGNAVDPMIYNGTTYLPVRAVAGAVGKAVYWDGPNYTVYLGDMDGELEYPTIMLKDMTNINAIAPRETNRLKDNYGNTYSYAITNDPSNNGDTAPAFECITAMKYSRLKGTLYVPEGTASEKTVFITIVADGHEIYRSPEMSKISEPVAIDVNVKGYNDIKIQFSHKDIFYLGDSGGTFLLCLADAGFYQ